jgi:hypothetical protein
MKAERLFVALLLIAATAQAAEIRSSNVLYLDELKYPPLELKAWHRAPITFSRDRNSVIAYLAKDQPVQVLGVGDQQFYVSAEIPTGPARGWVDSADLELAPKEMLETLQKRRERLEQHRQSIARHEVEIGMMRDEVLASLGKPDRKSRLRTALGDEEKWLYITYRYVPYNTYGYDAKGQLRPVISYRRVPSGHKAVTFREGEVVAIADEMENKQPPTLPIVVPPALLSN